VEERLQRLDLQELVRPWKEAIEAPLARDRVWLHGDLHHDNVILTANFKYGRQIAFCCYLQSYTTPK
jgi:aminoglycoside phosphotransferase (APT) family kinase protein